MGGSVRAVVQVAWICWRVSSCVRDEVGDMSGEKVILVHQGYES